MYVYIQYMYVCMYSMMLNRQIQVDDIATARRLSPSGNITRMHIGPPTAIVFVEHRYLSDNTYIHTYIHAS